MTIEHPTEDRSQIKRPRVTGLVGMGLLSSLFWVFEGWNYLSALNNREFTDLPGWVSTIGYALVAFGALDVISALLILLYRRSGLLLGLAAWGIGLVLTVMLIVGGRDPLGWGLLVVLVIQLAALYYIYIYLTRSTHRQFFH